jgi:HEAT repeat protein
MALSIAPVGCGRDPASEVIAKLHDWNPGVRRAAVRDMVEHPPTDPRLIDELEKTLIDKDTEVRYLAVEAIGQMGPAARPNLPQMRMRLADQDKQVRLRAAFAIRKIDPTDPSFMPVLTGALGEGDGRTLLEVASLGPDACWAVPTLAKLLSHESFKVRTLAAKALGSIGATASTATPALEGARRDSNPGVQKAAAQALARIQSSPGATK